MKQMKYPIYIPCQAAKNINVITWDNVLLPKNLNRLNKYLKKARTNCVKTKSVEKSQ
jgi:hypothetical protein